MLQLRETNVLEHLSLGHRILPLLVLSLPPGADLGSGRLHWGPTQDLNPVLRSFTKGGSSGQKAADSGTALQPRRPLGNVVQRWKSAGAGPPSHSLCEDWCCFFRWKEDSQEPFLGIVIIRKGHLVMMNYRQLTRLTSKKVKVTFYRTLRKFLKMCRIIFVISRIFCWNFNNGEKSFLSFIMKLLLVYAYRSF